MNNKTHILNVSKKTPGGLDSRGKKPYKAPSLQLLSSVAKMTAGGTSGPQFDVFTGQPNDAS